MLMKYLEIHFKTVSKALKRFRLQALRFLFWNPKLFWCSTERDRKYFSICKATLISLDRAKLVYRASLSLYERNLAKSFRPNSDPFWGTASPDILKRSYDVLFICSSFSKFSLWREEYQLGLLIDILVFYY